MTPLHQGTKVLHTPRLILRPFREEDVRDVFTFFASDPAVTRYLNWTSHDSLDDTERLLGYWLDEYGSDMGDNWAIEYEGHVVGNLSAVEMSHQNSFVQVAYCLSRSLWNQGLMTEALRAVIHFFLHDCCFHRVYARYIVENSASGRVMEKAGMRPEGVLRQQKRMDDGSFHDIAVYGILRGEE